MKRKLLLIGLFTLLTINPGAIAQSHGNRFCSFNGGGRVPARIVVRGEGFGIEWADGPKMTYVRLNVGPDCPNVVDKQGGYWYLNSHRDGLGFNLYNPSNRNEINCEA